MIAPMPPDRVLTAAFVLFGAVATACEDGDTAGHVGKIDALDARVAELERRTTDSGKALEPLAALPNTLVQTQQSLATMKAEQATLVARLARAGITQLMIYPMAPDGRIDTVIERFQTEVMPGVRGELVK